MNNTDEYTIYDSIIDDLPEIIEHHIVNHSEKKWARDDAHVNTCENRNRFLRTYLRKYRGVAKKYLHGYLDFLALILNEGIRWFNFIILSDYSPT